MVDLTQVTTSGFPGFSTLFTRFEDSNGITNLQATASYITTVDDTCSATYVTEICDYTLAIVNYPLLYQNYTFGLNKNISETIVENYTSDDDVSTAPFDSPAGLLSGLHWFADTYLASNSNIIHGYDPKDREMYIEISSGFLSSQYLNLSGTLSSGLVNCQFEWENPMTYIDRALNSVAFNAAFIAALFVGLDGSESDSQSFMALQTQPMIVYHSEYGFLAMALALLLSALLAVSTTIYGFWQIGHDTSLSPLETARALGAPVLVQGERGSGGDLKELIKGVGKKEVKYGVLYWFTSDGTGVEKLGIGLPHMLVKYLK
jgi:hypothetical protein